MPKSPLHLGMGMGTNEQELSTKHRRFAKGSAVGQPTTSVHGQATAVDHSNRQPLTTNNVGSPPSRGG